ncbi:odorant receptor 45b-like [Fopius arisanus]|uniref:Odorant receptor n=1 Tax=Fopius arisanus TaxID=64838 RepID=A0A9R1TUW2_9HYME|nr:PREDICTED: odorant receptor 45b-like [Fopius arisanus]
MSASGNGIRTKSVFPLEKSYLYFNFKCMTLLGLWNPYENGFKHWLYLIYTIWILGVIVIMRTISTFVRTLTADTLIAFNRESSVFAAEIAQIIKCTAFLLHRAEISELSNLFNWERRALSGEELRNWRDEVLSNSLIVSKTFTIVIIISAIQYFVFYFYSAFVQSDYQVEKLPMGSVPTKYLIASREFWFVFVVDYLLGTLQGIIALSQDAFLMTVMINIAAQLKILNFRVERCHVAHPVIEIKFNHKNLRIHFESIQDDNSPLVDPTQKLINCIKFHQQILKMLILFKVIYNKILLPQVLISLSMIVLQLQLIMGKQMDGSDALVAYLFLFGVIVQLLAYCWGGNLILVESEKTSDAIYASHWYNQNKIFRNNLKIFLTATKNPLVVTAGDLIALTAETFKNILSKGYSGAALLKNFE